MKPSIKLIIDTDMANASELSLVDKARNGGIIYDIIGSDYFVDEVLFHAQAAQCNKAGFVYHYTYTPSRLVEISLTKINKVGTTP